MNPEEELQAALESELDEWLESALSRHRVEFVTLEGGPCAGQVVSFFANPPITTVYVPVIDGSVLRYERSDDYPKHFVFVGHDYD